MRTSQSKLFHGASSLKSYAQITLWSLGAFYRQENKNLAVAKPDRLWNSNINVGSKVARFLTIPPRGWMEVGFLDHTLL